MIHFDTETPADAAAREALLDRVMGPERFQKPSERLREGRLPARDLALVARDGDILVGSVRLWHICAGDVPALLLGPLAIETHRQGTGIGATLMRLAIARASMAGHTAIILVGDPEYYARFGFTAEATEGLVLPGPVERRRFLGLELEAKALVSAGGPIIAAGALPYEDAALVP